MFRDDLQKSTVCLVLLDQVGLAHLWSEGGPTEKAKALVEADGGDLLGDARLMLLACWDLWSGEGGPTMGELRSLSPPFLVALASLMRCLGTGPEAVDQWLRAAPSLGGEATA
jgi:hypothetical protein